MENLLDKFQELIALKVEEPAPDATDLDASIATTNGPTDAAAASSAGAAAAAEEGGALSNGDVEEGGGPGPNADSAAATAAGGGREDWEQVAEGSGPVALTAGGLTPQQHVQLTKLRTHFHKDVRKQLYGDADDRQFFEWLKQVRRGACWARRVHPA